MSDIVKRNKLRKKQEKYAKVYSKVNSLLEQYIGGQVFFTELDKAVKFDSDILEDLMDALHEEFGDKAFITIASGEIGLALHNFGIPVDLLVPGGLRFDPTKINLTPYRHEIVGKNVIFVDDSYFSGKTFAVIKEEVEGLGGTMLGAYVAYDGAKDKDTAVHSLYRYYDHFDILGRPLKEDEDV